LTAALYVSGGMLLDWFGTSVNYWGTLIMLIGLVFNILAKRTASQVSEARRELAYWLIRIAGLLFVIIGALITMEIIGGYI
jgi:predicted membrane protein